MERNYSREEMIEMAMNVAEAYLLGLGIQLTGERTLETYFNVFDMAFRKFERENKSFDCKNLIFSESEIMTISKAVAKVYVHLCTKSIGPIFERRAVGCYFEMLDYTKEQLVLKNQAKLENVATSESLENEKTHKM